VKLKKKSGYLFVKKNTGHIIRHCPMSAIPRRDIYIGNDQVLYPYTAASLIYVLGPSFHEPGSRF